MGGCYPARTQEPSGRLHQGMPFRHLTGGIPCSSLDRHDPIRRRGHHRIRQEYSARGNHQCGDERKRNWPTRLWGESLRSGRLTTANSLGQQSCECPRLALSLRSETQGVCVRMKIYDSTYCFVNSRACLHLSVEQHLTADLAAFATALERRRADFHVLLKTLTFPRPAADATPAFDEFLPELRDKLISLEDSHVVVSCAYRAIPCLTLVLGWRLELPHRHGR